MLNLELDGMPVKMETWCRRRHKTTFMNHEKNLVSLNFKIKSISCVVQSKGEKKTFDIFLIRDYQNVIVTGTYDNKAFYNKKIQQIIKKN